MDKKPATRFLLSTLTAIGLAACAPPKGKAPAENAATPPDQCFIDTIKQKDISKSEDVQQLNCEDKYTVLCTEASTAAQKKCDADCLKFTKRKTQDPENQNNLLPCPADPVKTTIDTYDAGTHCVKNPRGESGFDFKVTCTVSYACTCDP